MKSRRVCLKGSRFTVARRLADAGIPFAFEGEAGCNTVGRVSVAFLPKLSVFLVANPDMEGRFARVTRLTGDRAAYAARSLRIGGKA